MAHSSPGVFRLTAVLNAFRTNPSKTLTLTDVLAITGLSRATCHAVLTTLVEDGYLSRDTRKRFSLGYPVARLGAAAQASLPRLRWALPHMQAIADQYDAICSAFVRYNHDVIVRESVFGGIAEPWSVPRSISRGTRLPLRPPFGASLLCRFEDDALIAWLEGLEPSASVHHRALLINSIRFARRKGYTVVERIFGEGGRDQMETNWLFHEREEHCPVRVMPDLRYDGAKRHVASIQVPVLDRDGAVLFALGASGFSHPHSIDEIGKIGASLKATGLELTKHLSEMGQQ